MKNNFFFFFSDTIYAHIICAKLETIRTFGFRGE
jgi:hypothetical protein